MKLKILTISMLIAVLSFSCESKSKDESDEIVLEELMDENEIDEFEEEMGDLSNEESEEEENLTDAFAYDEYTFDKNYKEELRKKDIFDRRDRENDEMIKVSFSDGQSGSIVYRDGFWYNYTIREDKEILFATKDDALQYAYDWSRRLQDAGAAIATMVSKKSRPLKKDGTPDLRFKENSDLK